MKKEELDQLYHLLRVVSNDAADGKNAEPADAVFGLCKHLLCGGDYLSLIQYSAFYGRQFLIEPVYGALKWAGWHPERIVEFGAGLGWLGRGLSVKFGLLPALFVDKRHWSLIDVVADLETDEGVDKVLNVMKDGDLIVMSDFLHCVEEPLAILEAFSKWNTVAIELMPESREQRDSWSSQLLRYGGEPISDLGLEFIEGELNRQCKAFSSDPHKILLISSETEGQA